MTGITFFAYSDTWCVKRLVSLFGTPFLYMELSRRWTWTCIRMSIFSKKVMNSQIIKLKSGIYNRNEHFSEKFPVAVFRWAQTMIYVLWLIWFFISSREMVNLHDVSPYLWASKRAAQNRFKPTSNFYWPFQVGALAVVPSCLLYMVLVIIIIFLY